MTFRNFAFNCNKIRQIYTIFVKFNFLSIANRENLSYNNKCCSEVRPLETFYWSEDTIAWRRAVI